MPVLDDATVQALAASLAEAERTRRPVAPLTEERPWLTPADAYRVQQALVGPRLAAGARVVGHKVGLTSKAMQDKLGVGEPDYSVLLSTMQLDAEATFDLAQLIQPRIEPEIAFVLRRPLRGPGVTTEEAVAAVHASAAAG